MDHNLSLYRILSGKINIKLSSNETFILDRPTIDTRLRSEELYNELLYELSFEGLPEESAILTMMMEHGIWSEELEEEYDILTRDIKTLKIKLYELYFRTREREIAREALRRAKARLLELETIRYSYEHLSPSNIAMVGKMQYLICSNLKDISGNKLWPNNDFLTQPIPYFTEILDCVTSSSVGEETLRYLARNEPWRSIWAASKREGKLYGIPPIEYTDEQRHLAIWSMIYDSVFESVECPPDEIIDDNDSLDGWLLVQKNKRESEAMQRKGEALLKNDKMKKAGEVFVVANTKDDADKINLMNSEDSRRIKERRMQYLNKHGRVSESNMPDTKQKIMMELNRMQKEHQSG
jgi:hypothetical protein